MEERNKRVLVGMSGGIDSTATCLMLQEEKTLKNKREKEKTNKEAGKRKIYQNSY